MQVLAEKDTSQLQHTQLAIEKAVKATFISVLEYMKRYYTEEKMARMMDNLGKVTYKALK